MKLCHEKVCRLDELAKLHFRPGSAFSSAALAFLYEHMLDIREIDLIASHGQTIYHLVEEGHVHATLQLGEAAIIAYPTIANFRVVT